MTAPWPFHISDPVLAVHYAVEGRDCPWNRPESCPRHAEASQMIEAYQTWLAAHHPAARGATP